jgi:hypothetical protein
MGWRDHFCEAVRDDRVVRLVRDVRAVAHARQQLDDGGDEDGDGEDAEEDAAHAGLAALHGLLVLGHALPFSPLPGAKPPTGDYSVPSGTAARAAAPSGTPRAQLASRARVASRDVVA